MSDARSYRSGPESSIATPSSSVDPSFVNPQTYGDYVAAARANALSPDSPLSPNNLSKLSELVSSNPGMSPDAAIAALTAGLSTTSGTVQDIIQLDIERKYQQAMKDAADQRKQADQLSGQGAEGFFKGTARTAFNVMDAPFQVIMNAVNDTIAEAVHPEGPTASFSDVLFNTDAAHQMEAWASSDPVTKAQGDFGTGWLPDPNSTGAKYKYNEDVRLSNGMAPTLGGKLADAIHLQEGTHPYSVVSGLVDLGSRVLDPTMYVGGAEVQGLLRGGKAGLDAAALTHAAGDAANFAKENISEAERLFGASEQAKADMAARTAQAQQELTAAREQLSINQASAESLRDESTQAGYQADTTVPRQIQEATGQALEKLQQDRLSVDAAKKRAVHEYVDSVKQANQEVSDLGAQKADLLANDHNIPEPDVGPRPEDITGIPPENLQGIPEEVKQNLDQQVEAYRDQHYAALQWIESRLTNDRDRKLFREQGLFPLKEIEKAYGDTLKENLYEPSSKTGQEQVEYINAFLQHGLGREDDLSTLPDVLSRPFSEWDRQSQLANPNAKYNPDETILYRRKDPLDPERKKFVQDENGKDKVFSRKKGDGRQRYVKLPWVLTKDHWDNVAFGHQAHLEEQVVESAQAAHDALVAESTVKVINASDASRESIDAVRSGVLSSAEKLGEEFNLPEETIVNLMGVDGGTAGEVIDNVKNVLAESGLSSVEVEKYMYTLNDELVQHRVVVDEHPDLAPAGSGRDVADVHQSLHDAHQNLSDISAAHQEYVAHLDSAAARATQDLHDMHGETLRQLQEGEQVRPLEEGRPNADNRRAEAQNVAMLEGRSKVADSIVEQATKERDEFEAALKVLADQVGAKVGKEVPEDTLGQIQLIRDVAGLRVTVDGADSLIFDKGVKFLLGTKAEPLYRAASVIDNPAALWNLTRGKLPVEMCNDLAAAKSVDEVRNIFVSNIGAGMIDKSTGKLMSLRLAGRSALGGKDPDVLIGPYQQSFGPMGKAVFYGNNIGRRNVPWSHSRDISDHEGMVGLASDTINYMDRGWRNASDATTAFHDEWVTKMMEAATPEERRTTWYRLLDAVVERGGIAQGLPADVIADMQQSLKASIAQQRQVTAYLAEARAANIAGEELMLNGQKLPKDIALLESQMSNRVMSPDWRLMRRALKNADTLKRAADANPELREAFLEASNMVFDDFWRTSVLTFRGGYVLRNNFDIAARQLLAGHPSMFTNPWGIMALALGHKMSPNSFIGKLLNAAERADLDVTGAPYAKVDNEDSLFTHGIDGYQRLAARNTSLLDPGSISQSNRIGIMEVDANSPHFHAGWANEIGMLYHSPLANEVFKVMNGKPSTPIKQWIKQTGSTDARDATVDYFWNGPGRATLDKFFDSSSHMRDLIKSPEDLKGYMFGEDAVALEQRWKRVTLDMNPTIVDHIKNDGFRDAVPDGSVMATTKEFNARRQASVDLLKQVASSKETRAADFPVKKVGAPIWVNKAEQNAWTIKMRQATDWFFHGASNAEKYAGYLPEFQYQKWERAADLASALHPEDAAKLLETAKETLGGGFYYSWASKTLRRLEENVARAKGNGGFDLDTLKRITDQQALNHVQRMFYDAQKRNAFGHATRLISPFAQAWANSLKTWGVLAAQHPEQVYRVESLYEAGMGKNTSPFDNPSNPDNALFYQDPKTGQAMVGIPLAGDLLAIAGSLTSMAHGGQPIDPAMTGVNSPVSSFNLLFQNGLLPSVGPAITIPATSVDSTQQYNAMIPDWLKKTLVPYVNVNPDTQPGVLEAALPGWLGNVLAGIGVSGFQERNTKYLKPAMGTLFSKNPSRYLNSDGLLDDSGQSRLLTDAQALSFGLSFSKGLLQNMSAGSVMPDLYAKDKNGNNLSQLVLGKEYNDLEYKLGSRQLALATMADKYGMDVLMTMLPNREFGYLPTTQAYQFVVKHPDIADNNPTVLSLFLPGGGYSALLDRMNRQRNKNPQLTGDDMKLYTNQLLHQAQLGQLELNLTAGKITPDEFNNQTQMLNEAYKNVPQPASNNNNMDLAVAELRTALKSPELANTQAGRAIDVYMRLRDSALESVGKSLAGQNDAPMRSWLRLQGESLVVKYPEFAVAWAKVFRREVEN